VYGPSFPFCGRAFSLFPFWRDRFPCRPEHCCFSPARGHGRRNFRLLFPPFFPMTSPAPEIPCGRQGRLAGDTPQAPFSSISCVLHAKASASPQEHRPAARSRPSPCVAPNLPFFYRRSEHASSPPPNRSPPNFLAGSCTNALLPRRVQQRPLLDDVKCSR